MTRLTEDRLDISEKIQLLTDMTINYPNTKAALERAKCLRRPRQNKNTFRVF